VSVARMRCRVKRFGIVPDCISEWWPTCFQRPPSDFCPGSHIDHRPVPVDALNRTLDGFCMVCHCEPTTLRPAQIRGILPYDKIPLVGDLPRFAVFPFRKGRAGILCWKG